MASKVHGLDTTGLLGRNGDSSCASGNGGGTNGTGSSNKGALLHGWRGQLARRWRAQSLGEASGGRHDCVCKSGDGSWCRKETVWDGDEEPGSSYEESSPHKIRFFCRESFPADFASRLAQSDPHVIERFSFVWVAPGVNSGIHTGNDICGGSISGGRDPLTHPYRYRGGTRSHQQAHHGGIRHIVAPGVHRESTEVELSTSIPPMPLRSRVACLRPPCRFGGRTSSHSHLPLL